MVSHPVVTPTVVLALAIACTAKTTPSVSPYPPEDVLLWPKPQQQTYTAQQYRVVADGFRFDAPQLGLVDTGVMGHGRHHANRRRLDATLTHAQSVLSQAFGRYRAICFPATSTVPPAPLDGTLPLVEGLEVTVTDATAPLTIGVSEKYTLTITARVKHLPWKGRHNIRQERLDKCICFVSVRPQRARVVGCGRWAIRQKVWGSTQAPAGKRVTG